MSRLRGLDVVVAGAGAVGAATALRLTREGAAVVMVDPAEPADNASGVAAGMLAPAFEAALDPVSTSHFDVYVKARDAWNGLERELLRLGAAVERSGALWVGSEADQAGIRSKLERLGAACEQLTGPVAERLSPGLKADAGGVFTPEDWRLDPAGMLQAFRRALQAEGGAVRRAGLAGVEPGSAILQNGEALKADAVVLATGLAPTGLSDGPRELFLLQPIKGQIARLERAGPRSGPVVRAEGVYVVPAAAGAAVGATMEPGVDDRRIDPDVVERLAVRAAALYPALAGGVVARGQAGVRSATPDGLPMVGPSSVPGVFLALGARRNGWLLAPLMAEVLADAIVGEDPGPLCGVFDPGRFSR